MQLLTLCWKRFIYVMVLLLICIIVPSLIICLSVFVSLSLSSPYHQIAWPSPAISTWFAMPPSFVSPPWLMMLQKCMVKRLRRIKLHTTHSRWKKEVPAMCSIGTNDWISRLQNSIKTLLNTCIHMKR